MPYLIGRATAVVEHLVKVPRGFVSAVRVSPLQKLPYHLREALKLDNDELTTIMADIQEIPATLIDPSGQFFIGYYHQKAELDKYRRRLEIGACITELRQKKGLSIRELASIVEIDHANIGKIERGRYNVSIDILGRIADALGAKITIK